MKRVCGAHSRVCSCMYKIQDFGFRVKVWGLQFGVY